MSSPGLEERPQIPTTGMRGGLGKTLLTAFLILAIVPLSTISWYATQRERHDIQREVTAKLSPCPRWWKHKSSDGLKVTLQTWRFWQPCLPFEKT